MRIGAKIFGVISGLLLVYLLVGILLPGAWEAEVEATFPAPPFEIFPYLNRMDQWVLWNPMPEDGSDFVGSQEGVGAGIDWDDPQYGKGQVRILESEENRRVDYEVRIEDGALMIHGRLFLEPRAGGTRLFWTEKGDFGWNPLMGYAARGMASSQGEAMRAHLDQLGALLRNEAR